MVDEVAVALDLEAALGFLAGLLAPSVVFFVAFDFLVAETEAEFSLTLITICSFFLPEKKSLAQRPI